MMLGIAGTGELMNSIAVLSNPVAMLSTMMTSSGICSPGFRAPCFCHQLGYLFPLMVAASEARHHHLCHEIVLGLRWRLWVLVVVRLMVWN